MTKGSFCAVQEGVTYNHHLSFLILDDLVMHNFDWELVTELQL